MRSKKAWVGMFVMLATTASALAGSVPSTSASELSGTFKGGTFVLEGGGATLECTSAAGKYEVVKPTSKEPKWEKQEKSNPGQDLLMKFETWTGCTAKSSLIKGAAATVKTCELHMQDEHPEKTPISTGNISYVTACTIEVKAIGTCVITLPQGQSELHEVNLENQENDLLIDMALSGLTAKPNSACLGIKETKEGKLKEDITAVGVIHL